MPVSRPQHDTKGSQLGQMWCFRGLLILGSGLNERTSKRPAGVNKRDGPERRGVRGKDTKDGLEDL